MSYTAIESREARTQNPESVPLKALFFMPSASCRAFAGLLVAMLAAGHRVLLALDPIPGRIAVDDLAFLQGLQEHHSTFSYRVLPAPIDLWRIPANAIRRSLDYIRYLSGDYAETDPRREQARLHAPRAVRALLFLPPFRWTFGRRFLAWVLRRLEAGMPISRVARGLISEEAPDLVLVSPLVDFGSNQGDYLRAADAARIPSIFIVGDDDDLSAKGTIRDVPTLTVTWSERQADDAVRVQGLPDDRVVVVVAEDAGNAPAPSAALAVVERTAPRETVPRHQGRILRPLLWLLTPLLAVVLPISRPRRSAQAAARIVREIPERRRRRKAARERRHKLEHKARVDAEKRARAEARDQDRARVEADRAEKSQRAEAKEKERVQKEQEREKVLASKQEKLVRAREKEAEAKLKRAETKRQATTGDEPRLQQVDPTTRTRGPEGERERDLGQGAPASGEGTVAGGQGAEGTDAGGQGAEGTRAEGGEGSG